MVVSDVLVVLFLNTQWRTEQVHLYLYSQVSSENGTHLHAGKGYAVKNHPRLTEGEKRSENK